MIPGILLDFAKRVVASGNESQYQQILEWMTTVVVNRGVTQKILVLLGSPDSGKTTFVGLLKSAAAQSDVRIFELASFRDINPNVVKGHMLCYADGLDISSDQWSDIEALLDVSNFIWVTNTGIPEWVDCDKTIICQPDFAGFQHYKKQNPNV